MRALSLLAAFSVLAGAEEWARLPFHPTALTVPAGTIAFEESHRFAGAIAPGGEWNLYRHALGMDSLGNTSMEISYGILRRLQATLAWESRRQTAGVGTKYSVWRQDAGAAPFSFALWLNVEARNKGVEKSKKFSSGGGISLERSLFEKSWVVVASALGQSHANVEELGAKPVHAAGVGVGLIRRGSSITAFGDFFFPLVSGNLGYRNEYGGRAPDGIAPMAFGAAFPLWRGSLAVTAANTPALLYSNFMSGAGEPTATRLMKWRLGLAYRYSLPLRKGSGT